MALKKYAGEEAVARIADYVNRKLTVVSSMPLSPNLGDLYLYIGLDTPNFVQGGIYLFNGIKWELKSSVDLSHYETSFSCTQSEWDALDPELKALYQIVNITDDFEPEGGDDVVAGYYDPTTGKFYKESTFTTEIAGQVGVVYIELLSHALYVFDANLSSFVISSGGGAANNIAFGYYYENKFYADGMHQTEIAPDATKLYVDLVSNSIYRYNTTIASYVAISGGGNYTAGFGISIDNSEISSTDFVGTEADWEALSASEKAKYDFIHITDDTSSVAYKPGHSISDGTTEKTQRDSLVFEGFEVTDDSTNEVTKITDIPYTAGDGIEIDNHEVNVTEDRPATFVGTTQEWDALTTAEKSQYKVVNLTNDVVGGETVVVDTVESGNLNPVTSNAVAVKLKTDTRVALVGMSENYTIRQMGHYVESYYIIRNGFVFVSLNFTCVTPSSNNEQVCQIPGVDQMTTIVPPAACFPDNPEDLVGVIVQGGYIYLNHGVAGHNYGTCFMYPILNY